MTGILRPMTDQAVRRTGVTAGYGRPHLRMRGPRWSRSRHLTQRGALRGDRGRGRRRPRRRRVVCRGGRPPGRGRRPGRGTGAPGPGGRRLTRAGSSTWGAGPPSRSPAASRTRRTTWSPSSGPPSGPTTTTTASTPTARAPSTTSTGWSRSGCRSGPPSATSRTVSRPTTPGSSSAEARTPIPSTNSPSRSPVATSPGGRLGGWLPHGTPGRGRDRRGARVVDDARAEPLVVDGGEIVGVQVARRRRSTSRAGPGRGRAGHRRLHRQRGDGRRVLPVAHLPDPAWRIGTPADDGRGIRMGVGRRGRDPPPRLVRVRAAPRTAPPVGPGHPGRPPRRSVHQRGRLHRAHRAPRPARPRTASST